MSDEVYKLAGFKIGSSWVPVQSATDDPGIQAVLVGNSGSFYNRRAHLGVAKPIIKATTHAIGPVLTALTLEGAKLTEARLVYGKLDGPDWASGSSHLEVELHLGLGVIDQFGAQGSDAPASAEVSIYACDDGTNEPFTVNAGVAMPTVTHAADLWYLGPFFSGEEMLEISSLQWALNNTIWHEPHSGRRFPTRAHVLKREPKITIETHDQVLVSALTAIGSGIAEPIVYFRHFDEDTGRDADDATTHISLTIPKAYAYPGQGSGQWDQASTRQIVLDLVKDGSNAIATVSQTAAIAAPE